MLSLVLRVWFRRDFPVRYVRYVDLVICIVVKLAVIKWVNVIVRLGP